MGNQSCPGKADPMPPVCCKIGIACFYPTNSASSTGPGITSSTMSSWSFCALDLVNRELREAAHELLLCPFAECNGSNAEVLRTFIKRVQSGYLPNFFHSFAHAVDVLQMVTMLGHLMPWEALFSPAQRFALTAAALAHDLGHPGFSNVFLVEANDDLAVRYNDASPLENMHCSKLFEILRMQGADILGHFPKSQLRGLRKFMIEAIMRTDVAQHAAFKVALDEICRESWEAFMSGNCKQHLAVVAKEENQVLLAHSLLHVADVCHSARPWKYAQVWALRAQEEWFIQGDQERALGLPILPHHDRKTASLPDGQLGYIYGVVAPLVAAEVRLFHAWHEIAEALCENTQEWAFQFISASGEGDLRVQTDDRAQKIRSMLESAMQGRPFQLDSASKVDIRQSDVTTRLGSGDDINAQHVAPGAHKLATVKIPSVGTMGEEPSIEPSVEVSTPQVPLVREVRRWQERPGEGQNRELVLLYVVNGEAADPVDSSTKGRPILFRYAVKDDTRLPSEAVFSDPSQAQISVDAGCTQLESEGFDALLAAFLSRDRTSKENAEEPVTPRSRGSGRVSGAVWRSLITKFSGRTIADEV
eukprot:CAMPEP_0175335936 /NCGR_PEP_ID=MMETSP0095-20121207/3551_1 /TAXON_ID=311494 /ORGANISM="Alexandrium monilatum, Strain CCMP3105" /LENGTH=588 /DNA_ID=CAMNT_0016633273 /DNA_START=42 /DNA_END=1808 /DNA_ORIENTATION=-